MLDKADADRGRRLFFSRSGGQCSRCHQIGNRGNNFAPDLSGIGLRAKAKDIVAAILNPSARITEGFRTYIIVTEDGKTYTGVVVEETGLALKLINVDGRPVNIRKKEVEERRSIDVSAMPSNYKQFLTPQQVADLTAYLLTQRKGPASTKANRSP